MSLIPDNRSELAVMKFEMMLESNSVYFFDAGDFEDIINYYLDKGTLSKAKKAIQMGLDQHPADVGISVLKAEIMISEDYLDSAMRLLKELEFLDNGNPDIYIQEANIYSRKDQHYEAITALKKSLEYSEDDASDIYALLGMEHLFLGNHEEAKKYYMKCLSTDHEDYTALYNIVYCFDYLGQSDGAVYFLSKYLEDNPYCEIAWHQLGIQYNRKDMIKEALACYDFAIISDDRFIGAYLEKGKLLERIGRYNEAIGNYELTLSLEDPTAFAYMRIGMCHQAMGNDELAYINLHKAITQDPLMDKALYEMSKLSKKKLQYKEAFSYIERALEINRETPGYWKLYSDLLISVGGEADNTLIRPEVRPNITGNMDIADYISLVNLQIKAGELQEAVVTLKGAVNDFENRAELWYLLSVAYLMMADKVRGLVALQKALEKDFNIYKDFHKRFPHVFDIEDVHLLIKKFKST